MPGHGPMFIDGLIDRQTDATKSIISLSLSVQCSYLDNGSGHVMMCVIPSSDVRLSKGWVHCG